MKLPSRQSLWKILGYASDRKASDGFCDQVIARATQVRQHSPVLVQPWMMAAAAAVLILGMAIFHVSSPNGPELASESTSSAVEEPVLVQEPAEVLTELTEEFEVIVLVNELLAVNDPELLDDEAIAELLF